MKTILNPIIINTTKDITGPVFASYVFWVLKEAEKLGIHTLFFMARDGFVFKIIADSLAKMYFPSIKCKYFYCSRRAVKSKLFVEYMTQEGLNAANVGIVDSGWMGSVQRDIGCEHITGFYFGMFGKGYANCGTYRAYLFSPKERWWWRFGFNANVFECMCSADHGMCLGYKREQNLIVPVLSENIPNSSQQIQAICNYMAGFCEKDLLSRVEVKKRLWRFFHKPTIAEANEYGAINFAWDQGEQMFFPLAEKSKVSLIKLAGRHGKRPFYWPAATAVLLGYPQGIIRAGRWMIEVLKNGKMDLLQAGFQMRSNKL